MSYRVYKDKLLESTCWIYVIQSLQGKAVGIHMLNICLTEFTRTSCWNPHVEYMSYRVYKDKLFESTCWIYVLQSIQGQAVGIHMLSICLADFTRTSCWNPHVEYMSHRVYKDKLLESTCGICVVQSLQGQAVGIHMLNMSYRVYNDKLLESTCWIYVLQSLRTSCWNPHVEYMSYRVYKDKLLESACWIYVLQSLQGQAVGIHMLNICLTEFTRTSCWNPHVEYMSYRVYKDKLLESTCWIYVLQSVQGQAVGIHMLNICLT